MVTSLQKFNIKFWLVLLAVGLGAVVVGFQNTGSPLGLFDGVSRNKFPRDKPENMFYSAVNYSTSSRVVEKSGFAFLNLGDEIIAVQLEDDLPVRVTGIAARSDREILRFSEYAGAVYMLDSADLYRSSLDGGNLKLTVAGALDYEPMGDYIYSLKEYRGERRVFRCALSGGNEKLLFDQAVSAFWAYGGYLVTQLADQPGGEYLRFAVYNVLDGSSTEQLLPAGYRQIALDADALYYSVDLGGETSICRRAHGEPVDQELYRGECSSFSVGSSYLALLTGGGSIRLYNKKSAVWTALEGREFAAGSSVDISQDHVYVSGPEGVWITPVGEEAWRQIHSM